MLVDRPSGTGDPITAAIRSASRTTGTTFDYLLNTAIRESSLDPGARAGTSSARGLYQFIESTWLAMVKEEGPKFGLGRYADAIERRPGGRYGVRDPLARAEILKLREDPRVSSVMAGALARRNAAELADTLGRRPTAGELYLAHFLGAGGAKRLIALQRSNPQASAAAAFPEAARANRAVFHHADGRARSAAEVFAALTGRHETAPAGPALARAAPAQPSRAAVAAQPAADPLPAAARNGPAPRLAYAHPLLPVHSAFAEGDRPGFRELFRDNAAPPARTQAAVNPAVRELWGAPRAAGEPLDLLAHLKTNGRRTRLGS